MGAVDKIEAECATDSNEAIRRAIAGGDYSRITDGMRDSIVAWLRGEIENGQASGPPRAADWDGIKRRGRERLRKSREA